MHTNTFFLEGNSCSGSTKRFAHLYQAKGKPFAVSSYFGKVFTKQQVLDYVTKEIAGAFPGQASEAPLTIIGSSFGGHLGIHIAKHLIETTHIKVSTLVLAGTPPAGTADAVAQAFIAPQEIIEEGGRGVVQLLGAETMTPAEAKRFVQLGFGWSDEFLKSHPEDAALYRENIANIMELDRQMGKTRHDILSSLAEFGDEVMAAEELLARGVRILFINAELDPVINIAYVDQLANNLKKKYKNVGNFVISGSPHYSHWAFPDKFIECINNFEDRTN